MSVLPSLRATLRSDKQPPMSELSPNAKSALKAACPLLAGADIGRTRWPSSLLSIRKWPSGSAKPSTELFRGQKYFPAVLVGDQDFRSYCPGDVPAAAGNRHAVPAENASHR